MYRAGSTSAGKWRRTAAIGALVAVILAVLQLVAPPPATAQCSLVTPTLAADQYHFSTTSTDGCFQGFQSFVMNQTSTTSFDVSVTYTNTGLPSTGWATLAFNDAMPTCSSGGNSLTFVDVDNQIPGTTTEVRAQISNRLATGASFMVTCTATFAATTEFPGVRAWADWREGATENPNDPPPPGMTNTLGVAGLGRCGLEGDFVDYPLMTMWAITNPLIATSGDDVIGGLATDDVIITGDGDDIVCGQGGDDRIQLGSGNDVAFGQEGDDKIFGFGGDDTLSGGPGIDTLHGHRGVDTMFGGDGDDRMFGYAGNDVMHGGPGVDRMHGNFGEDEMYGNQGDDFMFGYGDDDIMYGGLGNDTMRGNRGNDVMFGQVGIDRMFGSSGDDVMRGGNGGDIMIGNDGSDQVFGEAGNDQIDGGINRDFCDGGGGSDTARRCEQSTGFP